MKKGVGIFFAVFLCLAVFASGARAGSMIYMNSGKNQARLINLGKNYYQEASLRNGTWYTQKTLDVRKVTTVRGRIEYYNKLKKVWLSNGHRVYFTPDWKYFVGSTWDPQRTKVRYLWPRNR